MKLLCNPDFFFPRIDYSTRVNVTPEMSEGLGLDIK